jgi:hypothetical protein
VEKITFVRHRTDANGRFLPMTNYFLDQYPEENSSFSGSGNGAVVRRTVRVPDFLFSAKNLGWQFYYFAPGIPPYAWGQLYERSDTSRWINNSRLNKNAGGAGPGVIQSQAHITFNAPGLFLATNTVPIYGIWNWGHISATNSVAIPR